MSALEHTASAAGAGRPGPAVSAHARELAARLSELFDKDCGIAGQLNDAQHRLLAANERLWSGLAPDAFGLIYDGAAPTGHSQIAELIQATLPAGGPRPEAAVLSALQEIHWQVRRAFCEYQSASEKRRQLAVEVGELALQLTDALCAAGFSRHDAQRVDVHQLAAAAWPATGEREASR
jgi:hypothetical protein